MKNPAGYGGIIKLSGKRRRPYAVRVTVGWTKEGKQIFKYISYHEKRADAVKALAEYNTNPYDIDSAKITFDEVYEKWTEIEFKHLSDSAVKGYKSAYKHCKPLYGKVFKELRKSHLQATIDAIKATSMQNITKNLFLKSYKYALENDIVEKNYAQFVTVERKESKEKVILTDNEINLLWENLNNVRYADLVLILLYTGMRVGELLDMKKEDVHLEERYMVGGSKTKAGKNRVIPLHHRIVPLIEKRMNESSSPWLYVNQTGAKLKYSTFIQRQWGEVTELLDNESITPHSCRHTFISNMSRIGVDQLIVKRIVGHSNSSVTEHYTHKSIEELVEAVDKLV